MTDERNDMGGPPLAVGDRVTVSSSLWPHVTRGTVIELLGGAMYDRSKQYIRVRNDEGDRAGVVYILGSDEVERDATPPRLTVVRP